MAASLVALALAVLGLLSAARFSPAAARRTLYRADFPKDFLFGTASSAYQYEGAARKDGKGPSIWDTYSAVKGNILGNANGNVAVDQYDRYKGDIQRMVDLGMDVYRMSIAWTRIYPGGNGKINQPGIDHYNNVINALLEKGIQPFVTLYHWDLPQKLEDDYGGWLSPKVVDDYANFADTCFKYFGDRVKHWITFNEPVNFVTFGYDEGLFPPARCSLWMGCKHGNSSIEPYIVEHHVHLSHAAAVEIYRKKYKAEQGGVVGITIFTWYMLPYSNSAEDLSARSRMWDFIFGWQIHPLLYGEYPSVMRELVGDRLPKFTKKQKLSLINSFDFLGLNYYTTNYVRNSNARPTSPGNSSFYLDSRAILTGVRNGKAIGPQGASSVLYIYPKGILGILNYIKAKYPTMPPIYITENGIDEENNPSLTLEQSLNDPIRIKFHKDHIFWLSQALKEGVDVRGYFVWTLLDDLEWTSGNTVRFGLYYVNFTTLERYPKTSAKWFSRVLKKN